MNRFWYFLVIVIVPTLVRATEVTISDGITQDTDCTINIPASVTNIYTGKITLTNGAKLIKTGSGMLVLANAENVIDGGLVAEGGQVRLDKSTAVGVKPITLKNSSITLYFNDNNARFTNDIIAANSCKMYCLQSAIIDGNISCGNLCRIGNFEVNGNSAGKNPQNTIWNGTITSTGDLYVHAYGVNTLMARLLFLVNLTLEMSRVGVTRYI